ncbi:hypothetical protein D3C86_1929760 [compost metagenome]
MKQVYDTLPLPVTREQQACELPFGGVALLWLASGLLGEQVGGCEQGEGIV